MRHARLSVIVALAFLTAPAALAQGIYTERGFAVELGYQSGDNASSFGGAVGYAVNRIFEAGLGVERESYDGSDANRTYITPRVRGYFARQGESMPVTIFGEGHYHFVSVSEAPDDWSESGWAVGLGAAHSLAASEALAITPIVSVMYSGYTIEFMGDSNTSNPFLINVALYASGAVGPGTLYGGPLYYTATEDGDSFSQFGVRLGMVFNQ